MIADLQVESRQTGIRFFFPRFFPDKSKLGPGIFDKPEKDESLYPRESLRQGKRFFRVWRQLRYELFRRLCLPFRDAECVEAEREVIAEACVAFCCCGGVAGSG